MYDKGFGQFTVNFSLTKFTFNGILPLNLRGIGKPKSAFPAVIRLKHWSSQKNGRLIIAS